MKHCGYCGREIPESAAFCPYCGKPLRQAPARQAAPEAKKVCGRCGKAMPATAIFCPFCGSRAGAAEAAQPRPQKPARPGKPSRPGKAPRPKKRRWIGAVAAVIVVCIGVGGFLAWNRGMRQDLFNPSAKYHTEENDYFSDGKEFTYASPTDESHLKPVVEGNDDIRYADNELIVQLANPTTEAEARRIARENGAELVGFISVSGTCQWRLGETSQEDNLTRMAETLALDERIDIACVNTVSLNALDSVESEPEPSRGDIGKQKMSDWLEQGGAWGYLDVKGDYAFENKDLMKDKDNINICVFDAAFASHYDLDYIYENITDSSGIAPDDWRKAIEHGTHVSGIIGANSDNDVGMNGVFPHSGFRKEGKNKTKPILTGKSWVGLSSIQILNAVVGMIIDGYKIINMSFGSFENWERALMYLYDNGTISYQYLDPSIIENCSHIYNKCLTLLADAGYQFLLCKSAGNSSVRKQFNVYYFNPSTNQCTTEISETQSWSNVVEYTDFNIPTSYDYFIHENSDTLKKRLLVCGAYDINHDIALFSIMDDRVDIMAPGVNIASTINNNALNSLMGTSMAAPFVAGAAACIWAMDSTLTAEEVRSLLLIEWPKSGIEGIQQHDRVVQTNDIVMISDSDYSHVSRPALNLKASMELAKAYIAWKNGRDIQPSNTAKLNIVQIKTTIDATEETPAFETSEARLKIVGADGRVYADGTGTDYQKKTERTEDGIPVYKPEESAYYIALPDGEYAVEVSLKGYQTIEASGLDPRKNYNEMLFQGSKADAMWCFVLKPTLPSPTSFLEPTPTPKLIPTLKPTKSSGGNTDYAAIFRAKLDELVDRYGAMAGEPQVKTVGREYNWAPIWTSHESEGMLFGDVFDYDADGAPELLTMRNAPGQGDSNFFDMLFLEIYEVKDGVCVLSDTVDISAEGLSIGGWPGTGVSAFRYSLNGVPAIGVLCETDSGSDWVVATLSYGYTGELLLMNNGVKYGSWPGAYAEEGEEGGYLSACFEAASERSAMYTSANGDTFEHWKVVANSGQNFYDAQVNDMYWKYLGKIGLSPRRDGALSNRLLQEGPFLQQPVNDHIRYHSAADSLEALEGGLTMLGNITTEYFYESDIYFARDYLYEDMQEFIAVGNLANGSYDQQTRPLQPTLVPVELPPVPHFDNEPASPTKESKASADDSEKALRKKVLEAYSGSGDFQAFGYSDFDWDGRQEAFALIGVYDDNNWENTCELWFVSADACTRLEQDKGYYPDVSEIVTEGGYTCFTVSEGYFGSGSKLRLWTVLDGEPVLHSQREYAGQSGEISREVYLSDRDSGGESDSEGFDDSGHGGTVRVREAGLRSNVRTGPGLGYDTLGELTGSMELEFLNETSIDDRGVTWYKVGFKGREGWISEKYTTLDTY